MTGSRADLPADPHQTRYRYSPVHREAAVCCVPNAGRLLPTLLGGSVLRRDRDVVLALPGPLVAELDVDAVPVRIEVDTTWPQSLELRVTVTAARPVAFALEIRRPAWAVGMTAVARGLRGDRPPVVVEGERGDRIVLAGTWWRHEAHVVVAATAQVRRTGARAYVVHGPRVLALPIPSRTTVTREHLPGFVDVVEEPTDEEHALLHLLADRPDLLRVVPDGVVAPFRRLGQGRHEDQVVLRTLRPLGTSALRRVTFPVGTPMPGPRGVRPRGADPGFPGPAA